MQNDVKLAPHRELYCVVCACVIGGHVIWEIIAWLKFLYGLLSIFPLILFVYGTHSPFSILPYKTFLVLDQNNGPE